MLFVPEGDGPNLPPDVAHLFARFAFSLFTSEKFGVWQAEGQGFMDTPKPEDRSPRGAGLRMSWGTHKKQAANARRPRVSCVIRLY